MTEFYRVPALLFTGLCHIIVVCHMLKLKYTLKKLLLYSGICIFFFVGISEYGYMEGGMKGLTSYLAVSASVFLYSCIVSSDCFSKKCFVFMSYFCLFTVLDNMLKLGVGMLFPQLSVPAVFYAAVVLRSAALLLILAWYRKYAMTVFTSLTGGSGRWWTLALIALLFYVQQAAVSILNLHNLLSKGHLFLMFSAVSFMMCIVYSVIFSYISYMKKDAEAALIRQNAEYLSDRLSVLQEAEEANRRMRHDMRHHMDAIAEYAKAGENSVILAYIREYNAGISETSVKRYSENGTVNSILSAYAGKAEEKGIDLKVRCNVPKELNVREIDLIALLGNLLENALHGCQESGNEKQGMEIHIRLQSDRLTIVCNNNCTDKLELSQGLPVGKSIGISSILSVCRKYDGNLDYKIENKICSACVVLHL